MKRPPVRAQTLVNVGVHLGRIIPITRALSLPPSRILPASRLANWLEDNIVVGRS